MHSTCQAKHSVHGPGHAWRSPPCCSHHFVQNNGPHQRIVALAVSGRGFQEVNSQRWSMLSCCCLIYCPSFVLVSPWNIKARSPQTLDISFKCSCHSEIATVISCNFALSVPSLLGVTCRSWKGNMNRLQGSIQQGGECPSSEPIIHLTIYLIPRVGVVWQNCVANNWVIILRMRCWRSLQNKQPQVMLCGIFRGSCWFRSTIVTCTGTCFSKNLPLWDLRSGPWALWILCCTAQLIFCPSWP